MSQKDLEEAGILLPEDLWGHARKGSTVNIFGLILAGILGIGSGALIYLGDGTLLTWIGVLGYFIFLGLFLFISLRAIRKQNNRLEQLLEKSKNTKKVKETLARDDNSGDNDEQ